MRKLLFFPLMLLLTMAQAETIEFVWNVNGPECHHVRVTVQGYDPMTYTEEEILAPVSIDDDPILVQIKSYLNLFNLSKVDKQGQELTLEAKDFVVPVEYIKKDSQKDDSADVIEVVIP